MVLRSATSLRGALEGMGPENRDFLGPWNGTSEGRLIGEGNFLADDEINRFLQHPFIKQVNIKIVPLAM